jgi:hypothetical protein
MSPLPIHHFPLYAPAFALASTSIHQAVQPIQVAARGDLHVPKVQSWLDRSNPKEVVIAAVGGG